MTGSLAVPGALDGRRPRRRRQRREAVKAAAVVGLTVEDGAHEQGRYRFVQPLKARRMPGGTGPAAPFSASARAPKRLPSHREAKKIPPPLRERRLFNSPQGVNGELGKLRPPGGELSCLGHAREGRPPAVYSPRPAGAPASTELSRAAGRRVGAGSRPGDTRPAPGGARCGPRGGGGDGQCTDARIWKHFCGRGDGRCAGPRSCTVVNKSIE